MEQFDNNVEIDSTSESAIQEIDELLKKEKHLSRLSWWLFGLSIASIFVSMFVLMIWAGAISPKTFTAGWVIGISIPLPVASLIFGFYMKKHGYQFYRNIVIGIIMTFFTVVYTIMFTLLCVDNATHDGAAVLRVEEALSMDIPDYDYASTETNTNSEDERERVHVLYSSKVYFGEEAKNFEKAIEADERWLKDASPNDLLGCMKVIQYDNREEYNIVYNVTTGELNCTPAQSGKYEFIQLIYKPLENVLEIYEYNLIYNK